MHDLLAWLRQAPDSKDQTLVTPSIGVENVAESGRGVYATADIASHTRIVHIPSHFLLNASSMKARLQVDGDQDVSQFYAALGRSGDSLLAAQLLSMYLCVERERGNNSFWAPFIALLPPLSDFAISPVMWSPKLLDLMQGLLPPLCKATLRNITDRFHRDYLVASRFMEPYAIKRCCSRQLFLWAWMCVNSRCLYMSLPLAKLPADNFTLVPLVDFVNHSNTPSCRTVVDRTGYSVYTTSPHSKGDQLLFNYGPHSNEFLWAEYGFVLGSGNQWNHLDITLHLAPLLHGSQADWLRELNYYGDYTVNILEGPSFRTQVALAALQELDPFGLRTLCAFVNGDSDGTAYRSRSRLLLADILEAVISGMTDCIAKVSLVCTPSDQVGTAITSLCQDFIDIAEYQLLRES